MTTVPAPTPAPAQAATTKPATSLQTSMLPGCCGLKTIHKLGCLGKEDALSKKHSEAFDSLVNTGKAGDGNWNNYGKAPDTIAILSTSKSYHTDPKEVERQKEFLKSKGWKELCTWKSAESGGTNSMWGSPGITVTVPETKKA